MSDSDGYSGWKSTPESSTKVIWNGKTLLPEAKWHPTQWMLLKNEQKMELEQYLRTLWKEVIEWLYKLVPPSLTGSLTKKDWGSGWSTETCQLTVVVYFVMTAPWDGDDAVNRVNIIRSRSNVLGQTGSLVWTEHRAHSLCWHRGIVYYLLYMYVCTFEKCAAANRPCYSCVVIDPHWRVQVSVFTYAVESSMRRVWPTELKYSWVNYDPVSESACTAQFALNCMYRHRRSRAV